MSLAPEISITIPVYNDASSIGKSIEALVSFLNSENMNAEIIVVNDGGTDATAQIVEDEVKKYPAVRFINRGVNRGKGYSIREGIKAASGNIIIFTDADLPYGTKYFKRIIETINNGADLVIANRNLHSNIQPLTPNLSAVRRLTHWGFAFLVKQLLNLKFSDTQAGLKAIKKEAADKLLTQLVIDGFAFDLELLVAAKKAGFKIREIPVSLENISKSNIHVLKDSWQMLKDILKIKSSI